MKLKVCGITSVQQMRALETMGVDYAGMIFTPGSSRYALKKLEADKEEIKKIRVRKVGVFVDQSLDEILKQTEDFGLDAVQLHGDEDEEFCATVNKRVLVIKAIRMEAGRKAQGSIERFATSCSYFLFDTSTADQFGGTGKQFNWSDLAEENIPLRFFLSGGIGPGDLNAVKEFNKKIQVHAVDINSRFETAPGIKDLELVKQFSEALKSVQL